MDADMLLRWGCSRRTLVRTSTKVGAGFGGLERKSQKSNIAVFVRVRTMLPSLSSGVISFRGREKEVQKSGMAGAYGKVYRYIYERPGRSIVHGVSII